MQSDSTRSPAQAAELVKGTSGEVLLFNCLQAWNVTVRADKLAVLQKGLRERLIVAADFLTGAEEEGLLKTILARWFWAFQSVIKVKEADALRSRTCAAKDAVLEFPSKWSAFKEWHAVAKVAAEERKTAQEFLRRQKLRDVETNVIKFQTEIRPRMLKLTERVVEMFEALQADQVFERWREHGVRSRLVVKTVEYRVLGDCLQPLRSCLEAWRCRCVRAWLRGAGFRLGQSVVSWGSLAVAQCIFAIWRGRPGGKGLGRAYMETVLHMSGRSVSTSIAAAGRHQSELDALEATGPSKHAMAGTLQMLLAWRLEDTFAHSPAFNLVDVRVLSETMVNLAQSLLHVLFLFVLLPLLRPRDQGRFQRWYEDYGMHNRLFGQQGPPLETEPDEENRTAATATDNDDGEPTS
eukprot:s1586_g1.t1